MFEHKVWLIYYKNESETFFMDFFFFPLLLPTDIDGDNSESKVFSEKYTRRRAIKPPTDLATPSIFFDMPHKKVDLSKSKIALFALATKRLGRNEDKYFLFSLSPPPLQFAFLYCSPTN